VNNLLSLWSALDTRRRAIVIGATAAMFVAILVLSRMATATQMALLYSGLDPASAGQVIAALEQRGVPYEVRGEAIHVDAASRDGLRMALAAEGLPANGAVGYELLDGMSGFGTTSQMFDVAYARATEGELARTILANPQIRSARVHIARTAQQPFAPESVPKASISVVTATGSLSGPQALALRHLVAGAVAGLRIEDVEIIDSVAGLIPFDGAQSPVTSGDARAEDIKHNVERLLAARVGPGRAIVEVSVEVVSESEQITERKFDPQGRVAISTDTEVKSGSSTDPAGQVTVASNLPDGAAGAGAAGNSKTDENRERVNYEVSETQREILRAPGDIRRLSVAVLVDGEQVTNPDGTTVWQPRSDAELAVLRELVASAVGLTDARGDVLTLKSLEFRANPDLGTQMEAGMFSMPGPIDVMTLVQLALLALVALVLGLFVVRPVLASANPALPNRNALPALPGAAAGTMGLDALTGEIADGFDLPDLQVVNFDQRDGGGETDVDDPVARLRRLIEERHAESVEILRSWMEVEEEQS
jgi:flagellar M-ring protein FliF